MEHQLGVCWMPGLTFPAMQPWCTFCQFSRPIAVLTHGDSYVVEYQFDTCCMIELMNPCFEALVHIVPSLQASGLLAYGSFADQLPSNMNLIPQDTLQILETSDSLVRHLAHHAHTLGMFSFYGCFGGQQFNFPASS